MLRPIRTSGRWTLSAPPRASTPGRAAADGATSTSCRRSCWRPRSTFQRCSRRCGLRDIGVLSLGSSAGRSARAMSTSSTCFVMFPAHPPNPPPSFHLRTHPSRYSHATAHAYIVCFAQAVEWGKTQGGGDDATDVKEADGGVAVDSADPRDRPQAADGERAVDLTAAAALPANLCSPCSLQ